MQYKFSPEYSKNTYDYISPENELWNASHIVRNSVQLWTIGAWGEMYNKSVNRFQFEKEWKEYHAKNN